MKQLIASVLLALSVGAGAQSWLVPNPISIILASQTYFDQSRQKVYYIRVESQAPTFEQAKQQAFRLASEQVAGTVVLSESELRNSRLTRDEVITYSSGIVDEYKIVDRSDGPNFVKLTVDVWIAENAMAQRVLAKSATEQGIDGAALGTRVASILEERRRGDNIFRAIINDIPRRSFKVKNGVPVIKMDNARDTWAIVDWEVEWDDRFFRAFYEAARATGRRPCTWRCSDQRVYYIQGFEFDDIQKLEMIVERFRLLELSMMFSVLDADGRTMMKSCELLSTSHDSPLYPMLSAGMGRLNLINSSIQRQTQLKLGQNWAAISKISEIRAEVVPKLQCRAQ